MATPTLDQLREQVRGEVIARGDEGYDEARAVYTAMIDRHPAVVVRAVTAGDVMSAVNFARDSGVDLAIRGGGHSVPGFGTCDDGVVIDLSRMRGVRVDPVTRTARAEGGATWGDFNAATHAFGLATIGGIISTTGVAGLVGHARGKIVTIATDTPLPMQLDGDLAGHTPFTVEVVPGAIQVLAPARNGP